MSMATTDPSTRRARRLLLAVDALLVVTLAAGLLAWFFDPFKLRCGPIHLTVGWGLKPVVVPALLLVVRVFLVGRARVQGGLLPRVSLGLGTVLVVLVSVEGMLAAAGIEPGPRVFETRKQDGDPVQGGGAMVYDAQLLWRFKQGSLFHGRRVNAMGFLDREVSAVKRAGVRRVICMGDSCSAQGLPTYAGRLHELLQETPPDAGVWEAFNTAVHGYSILQGLRLFEQRVRHFQPDVVTIFYGWNDHWLNDLPDARRMVLSSSPFVRALTDAIHRKRISAVLQRGAPDAVERVLRVPPADYDRGLRDLVRAIRRAGAEPLVLTAPRAPTLTRSLVHNGQTASVDAAIRLHDEYVELTRRVAGAEGARLLDLAAAFEGDRHAHHFSRDGVHFEDSGRHRIAELIHRELLVSGLR